ncbi:hypothetical protein [Parasedimentitalea psychrophila]|uniref:Uncharacterized protein n=1 Tax=Parasedimentitalea psychrophila TaxID=2997337 RepID=A0A9Y2L533_9RHOB|nr:hypothetical protein [Parasedimentitalea psychrophila]WIY27079.1 hypothetical protein QPJ95_09300 [Parasedimentitalea psychrophila]
MATGKRLKVRKTGLSHSENGRRLLFVLVELFFLFILLIAANISIFVDATILHNNLSEISISQFLQSSFILLSSVIFALGAVRYPFKRAYLVLVATLFGCMFIRENDAVFDLIRHGFWVVPTFCALIASGWYTARNLDTLMDPFLCHLEGRHSTHVYTGFLIVVVFSRLFGTGSFWDAVMGNNYSPDYKSIIQEGVELLGYVLIFHGSCMSFLSRFGDHKATPWRS